MAETGLKWWGLRKLGLILVIFLGVASVLVSAERTLKEESSSHNRSREVEPSLMTKVVNFLWDPSLSGYEHTWPVSCKKNSVFSETLILCLIAEKILGKKKEREDVERCACAVKREKGQKIHIS